MSEHLPDSRGRRAVRRALAFVAVGVVNALLSAALLTLFPSSEPPAPMAPHSDDALPSSH